LDGFVVQHARPGEDAKPGVIPFDPSDGLDEAELVAVGLTLNPDLQAKRLEIGEANALLISAGLWPNPVLSAGWRPGVSGAPGYTMDAELLVDLLKFWERSAKKGAATARIKEASAEIIAEEWRLVSEVRTQRLMVLSWEQSTSLFDEEVAIREKLLDLVKRRREAGDGTELDSSAAELDLADLRRDRRKAQSELESSRRELNRLLGLSPGYVLKLADSGKPIAITVYDDLEDQELERRFMTGRFELKAKEAAYERAESELQLAVYGQYPRFSIGPSFNREPEGTKYLGLGINLELPLFNRNQGEIASKENERERLRAEYSALLHRIKAGAYEALARTRRARQEVEIEEKEILPLIKRSQLIYEGAFKAKELGVLDWVSAQRRALGARRAYFESLVSYRTAVIQLESATGVSLSRPTDPNPPKKKE
jgi:outer membrane protein TolC